MKKAKKITLKDAVTLSNGEMRSVVGGSGFDNWESNASGSIEKNFTCTCSRSDPNIPAPSGTYRFTCVAPTAYGQVIDSNEIPNCISYYKEEARMNFCGTGILECVEN